MSVDPYASAGEMLTHRLRRALPGVSIKTCGAIVRNLRSYYGADIAGMIEWLHRASDVELLQLRMVGVGTVAELRAALRSNDYDTGQCNWVGEGVPCSVAR